MKTCSSKIRKELLLPKEIQNIAETELNEVPERIEEDISYIRSWLLKQSHIIAHTDDFSILAFLRSCKFSLEKTKKKLELFYTVKTSFPDVFRKRDPLDPKMQLFFQQNTMTFLPTFKNGPMLFLLRTENFNPDIISVNDMLRMGTFLFEVLLKSNNTAAVVGQAVLADFKNVSSRYVVQLTPSMMRKGIVVFQNAYPSRLKAVHFINVPRVLVSVFNLFKSLFSKKMQDRITFDTGDGASTIEKYFPLSVLPKEYGGTAGSFQDMCEKTKHRIEKSRKWFLDEDQYGCIKEKMPKSSKLEIDLSSMDGSFRKLEID